MTDSRLSRLQSAMLDHAKLRDAALEEAGRAEKAMAVQSSNTKLANLWRTYVYLTWLAERHDDWYQQEVARRAVEVVI